MKATQFFSDEYLEHCKKLSTEEILEFLENFRLLQEARLLAQNSDVNKLSNE